MNSILHFASHPAAALKNIKYRIPKATSSKRHVFIVGVPRSGTTLLKTLLVAHPAIGGSDYESTGIFGFRDIFQYKMGELQPEHIQDLLRKSGDIIEFYDNIVACLLERLGKQVFVDKLQVQSYRIAYVRRFFPNAVFIHIVRDGRDCYCSALHHPNVQQSSSIERFATYWKRSVALPQRTIAPERLFQVRYEDLTTEPAHHLAQLMEFVGLAYQEQQVDVGHYSTTTSIKKREVHRNLAKPINARSQGRWRQELSQHEKETFEQIAGQALAQFGYRDAS